MRPILRFAVALMSLPMLAACYKPQPPVGRWQGAYEDGGLIIVARLQIDSAGDVRVSAPNAITDAAPSDEIERTALRAKLKNGLAASWPHVGPLPLEFDGHAFHKPGGVAPQLEWNASAKRMTLVFYSGNRPSIRVTLDPVQEFSEDS